jgi:hypothetical protein
MDRVKNHLLLGNMLVMFLVLLSLWTGHSLAASGSAPSFAPVSSNFIYEGRLGSATGRYDFKFRLFADTTSTTPVVATELALSNVLVDSGEYVVTLGFGTAVFTGEARFLEVRYRVTSSDPTAPYTLYTRQPLLAVPYAQSLRPGAIVEGALADNTAAITGNTSSPGAYGLKGFSQQSAGVFGQSTTKWGVFGRSSSGQGIYGETYAENTSTVAGVYGKALQQGGIGVIGDAQLGNAWGVYGTTQGGVGVRGAATTGIGVSGSSASGSAGVYGKADGTTASGVEGNASGSQAAGVYGKNLTGRGVWGYTDSGTAGVFGQSNGAGASGVEGYANGSAASAGVYGRSSNGVAVWGRNEAGGIAMKAEGNAVQSADRGGWAKALLRVQGNGDLVRCYNGITGAASPASCGFTVTAAGTGGGTYLYDINFGAGFAIQDRFISLTGSSGAYIYSYPNATTLRVGFYTNIQNHAYYIMVY